MDSDRRPLNKFEEATSLHGLIAFDNSIDAILVRSYISGHFPAKEKHIGLSYIPAGTETKPQIIKTVLPSECHLPTE